MKHIVSLIALAALPLLSHADAGYIDLVVMKGFAADYLKYTTAKDAATLDERVGAARFEGLVLGMVETAEVPRTCGRGEPFGYLADNVARRVVAYEPRSASEGPGQALLNALTMTPCKPK